MSYCAYLYHLLEEYKSKYNIHYDVVLSLRVDVIFQNSFDFTDILDNTVYIPSGHDYGDGYENGWLNDQIAYGKIDVMKKYNSINPVYLMENKISAVAHPEILNFNNVHFHKLLLKRPKIQYYLDK